ncbi:MAG: hypothetical protein IPM84_23255 [Anaerolineae bacterium]|nr:hypothetical protein [Anaerolineae bacterium]
MPSVPIYIQKKIHPQSIINDLLAQAAKPGSALREAAAGYQLNLFADFNGGPEEFDQKVEFYQHEQNWANRLILGDSLLVMASLAEKEGLRGKVQMIYLDPPYGIKFGSKRATQSFGLRKHRAVHGESSLAASAVPLKARRSQILIYFQIVQRFTHYRS